MAKITIIGWYGTETIGDRAILAGLFNIFSGLFDQCEIFLGSLYPFVSRRTLAEDKAFHDLCFSGKEYKISLFNSKHICALSQAVKNSDFVIIGGGPLMDINEMYYLEYAFHLARKYKKKNLILGAGWGPLKDPDFQKTALNILSLSDLCILRDQHSADAVSQINSKLEKEIYVSCDPSIFAAEICKKSSLAPTETTNTIAVNFRKSPAEYTKNENTYQIYKRILENLLKLDQPIHLVPMHTFHVGDDDRFILNMLAKEINNDLITVQNTVLNLQNTMTLFANADFCVGTRFHSIVLQTILNGKNYIVDYTNKRSGKIRGFIDLFDLGEKFSKRYISLETSDCKSFDFDIRPSEIRISPEIISEYKNIYIRKIREKVL